MNNNYRSVFEHRIKEAFKNREKKLSNSDILWTTVSLILYQNAKDRIIVDIYKLFDDKKDFVKLISLLDGRTFNSPTKKDMEETLLLAVLYYEKNILGKSWKEIQSEFDFNFSTIKYGIRIKNLSNFVKQKIQELWGRKDGQGNERG